MFDVNIHFDDINISSIVREDIVNVQRWINSQQLYEGEALSKSMDLKELKERFIEYYMSENEFFLKIKKCGELIGIFKGRVEFKTPNEVLVWCYMLDKDFRGSGLGTRILNEVIGFFKENFGIMNFSTTMVKGNSEATRFWTKNKFQLLRITKNFFNIEGKSLDMIILKREDIK
jgi:RimJ/RimL family protein N-acetyltransferase